MLLNHIVDQKIQQIYDNIISEIDPDWKKMFKQMDEPTQHKFYKAINAWYDTNYYASSKDLLIQFAKEYPEIYKTYRQWLQQNYPDEIAIYKIVSDEIAQKIFDSIIEKIENYENNYIEFEPQPHSDWSNKPLKCKERDDIIYIKCVIPKQKIWHGVDGHKFLKRKNFMMTNHKPNKSIIIELDKPLKLNIINDIELKGRFKKEFKKAQKKSMRKFIRRLKPGVLYKLKPNIFISNKIEHLANGLIFKSYDKHNVYWEHPNTKETFRFRLTPENIAFLVNNFNLDRENGENNGQIN